MERRSRLPHRLSIRNADGDVGAPGSTPRQSASIRVNSASNRAVSGSAPPLAGISPEAMSSLTGIVLKYRVPNNREGALQDLQRAVRLVRSRHKEWNIDPTRLGVMGFSAGGHLCARFSTHSGTAFYPPLDEVDRRDDRPDFAVLVYPAYLGKKGLLADDITVSAKVPPSFLTQAEDDKGFIAGTKIYAAALQEAKVPHEFALYQTGGHGYGLRCEKEARTWPDRCATWLKNLTSSKK